MGSFANSIANGLLLLASLFLAAAILSVYLLYLSIKWRRMKKRTKGYNYYIIWSDNEYVGLCVEFPSLSFIASTPERAMSGIVWLVADALHDMKKSGEEPPKRVYTIHR